MMRLRTKYLLKDTSVHIAFFIPLALAFIPVSYSFCLLRIKIVIRVGREWNHELEQSLLYIFQEVQHNAGSKTSEDICDLYESFIGVGH